MKPITYIAKPEMENQNPWGYDKMVLFNITDSAAPKDKKNQPTEFFQRYYFICDDETMMELKWDEMIDLEEVYTIDPNWNNEPDVNQQISDLTQQVSNLTKIMMELIQIQKRVF
tara:strand:- start:853 stop:1194 length:342 start_codon:yes stop_codon:yes gene_type:complete